MKALVIDHDHRLGLELQKEFKGIRWQFKLGPKGHSPKQRGLSFLIKTELWRYLNALPPKIHAVKNAAARREVERALGEKLSGTAWIRHRDSSLGNTGWRVSGHRRWR